MATADDRRGRTGGRTAGALYGAYKDSPHESFLLRRFVREIAIALTVALGLALLHESASGESLFVLYVSIFALTRTATEFWKLFVRVEPQDDYRIPTQIHWVKGIVRNPGAPLDPWHRFSVVNLWHLRAGCGHSR